VLVQTNKIIIKISSCKIDEFLIATFLYTVIITYHGNDNKDLEKTYFCIRMRTGLRKKLVVTSKTFSDI